MWNSHVYCQVPHRSWAVRPVGYPVPYVVGVSKGLWVVAEADPPRVLIRHPAAGVVEAEESYHCVAYVKAQLRSFGRR